MSHHSHRKEKDCLNCGATVEGPFCHICGQENIEPRESAWQLIVHFFNDITHFDGKFFTTLKVLIFRPGYLSKEYMLGRRAGYLNPVRMYLFTSFIFFLIFFSLNNLTGEEFAESERLKIEKELISEKDFTALKDSIITYENFSYDNFTSYLDSIKNTGDTSGPTLTSKGNWNFAYDDYQSKEEYDSLIKIGKIRDGWFSRKVNYKAIEINEKYKNKEQVFFTDFLNILQHNFPQMLFVSLPFMALFLKLFYLPDKKFYYVGHAIFMVHFYIFIFIMMLLMLGVSQLQNVTGWSKLSGINTIIILMLFLYLYRGMRNFYGQSRVQTILRFFLFLMVMFFLMFFLIIVFAIFSIFQV